jgi:serine/threonine-protein kinase
LQWVEQAALRSSVPGRSSWQLVNRSANGTFLNGFLVTQSQLPAEGVLQLAQGGPSLRFQAMEPPYRLAAGKWGAIVPPTPLPVAQLPAARCSHAGNPPENLFCIHCGQPLHVEKIVRQYQVLRTLGRGGMGTTYLAWSPAVTPSIGRSTDRLRVLKEMNADIARIPKAQELFEREAATLKRLNHPGIPQFDDFFIEAGKKYLVMELIHGQDLEKHIRQKGPTTVEQAIDWMMQTCEVLTYLHTRPDPIIHRDIKPSNLLLRAVNQRIVLIDFGAVKAVGIPSGTRIGAEGYSAPEQTQGHPVIQSDLFAIGACLIYLLSGESPQHFYRRTRQGYRLMPNTCAAIPAALCRVIERVTEPKPSDRYRTAQALAQALAAC